METLLLSLGLVLFLLGLLTGLFGSRMRNPRMALASHLEGMTNGPFLMIVGLMWPRVDLPHVLEVLTVALLVYSTYANWLATQLAAVWGAGRRYTPIATGDHEASPMRERVVGALLTTLAPAILVAVVLLLVGLLR
jgi:hydroxylaminobenzene mutase